MKPALILDGSPLTPDQVETVARGGQPVKAGPVALQRVAAARGVVDAHLSDGKPHYGINTGFGSLSQERIADAALGGLQSNLLRSHAAGVGAGLPEETVRATMLLTLASLLRGRSGVRPAVTELLAGVLNAGIVPVVPETGSVGASGDLAPLAHIALVLVGEGEAWTGEPGARRLVSGAAAIASAGLQPLKLGAKEGLALINGTHLMAAQAALLAVDFDRLFSSALAAAAMSIDACRATDEFLDSRIYQARNQPGPARVAERLRTLLAGSQIIPSHRENDPRVQDPYSFRCAPVVLGAVLDAAGYFKQSLADELGAVTDNPLVFAESMGAKAIVSAGNFHGMPIALPTDLLAISIAHAAGISERRTFYMLSAVDGESHLPAFLSPSPGLHSGLMIAQYTAAACCNEIIGLAAPATVANISTSAGMEDYNSYGPRAAAKARRALELATNVVAIELLCAAQALEFHRPLRSGQGVERAHATIRSRVAKLEADRPPAPDIAAIADLVRTGQLA